MTITEFNGKNVCLLGFGREGQASLRALEKYAPDAEVTVADQNTEIAVDEKHWKQVGTGWLENLDKFDVIIKSPGIPPQPEFEAVQEKITNSTQIFLDTVKEAGSLVIGITGTKGKSTTASLIYEILKAAGKDVHLVGNIGIPALDFLDKALCHTEPGRSKNTIFVQEMSSFQLMNLTSSPPIAVVTSFFPEHLDYHQTMENYMDAKQHIARFQATDDVVFFDKTSEGAKAIAQEGDAQKIPFSPADTSIKIEDTSLLGEHNLHNIAGAESVAKHLGISDESIRDAVAAFEGLPHRLQNLGVHNGVQWVNDSISTTPETTIAALDALPDTDCIILGGKDRGLDYSELGKRIADSNIQHVILLGESSKRIQDSLGDASVECHQAKSMEEVVSLAKTHAKQICLLSPASASHDMFKDFEERGNLFAEQIVEQ